MTNKQTTIAVVGFGYWGKKLAAASAAAGLTVVVVDPAAQQQTAYPQTDWTTVLTDSAIDGIIIATPEKTHAELVQAALTAHKAVLVEKPATTTSESWSECVALATKHDLPLLVDYTFLYSRALEQWKTIVGTYAAELGSLKQLTTVRRAQLNPERITAKAMPIWWDVVIHDLYLLRAVLNATPADWKIINADLPSQIKASARCAAVHLVADYSWVAVEPERSWFAEYEQGTVLWRRVAVGEAFTVVVRDQTVFSTTIPDQNPSPLDSLIRNWLLLWGKKNLAKLQKKHWQEVAEDVKVLTEISETLTTQAATH